MKVCKVVCSNKKIVEAYLTNDNHVVFDFCRKKTAEPVEIVDGKNFYAPMHAIDARKEKSSQLMPLVCDDKWGYYSYITGEVVHSPKWGWGSHYTAAGKSRKVARINAEFGDIANEEVYDYEFDPCNADYNGKWGLIDFLGNEIIPPNYQYLSPVRKGVMLAKKNDLWGVVDTLGKVVLPIEYDNISFLEHIGILVQKGTDDNACYSVYSYSGAVLIENLPVNPIRHRISYSEWYIKNYHKYNIGLWTDNFELHCIEHTVKKICDKFGCMFCEHNGYYTVFKFVINKNGKITKIIPFGEQCKSFEDAKKIMETALEQTARELRIYEIQKCSKGEEPDKDLLYELNNTKICRIEVDGKWGYSDLKSGKIIHSPNWSFFEPFVSAGDGRYIARFNIDENLEDTYIKDDLADEFYPDNVEYNGKWGVIESNGNVVVQPVYQFLSKSVCGYYIAKQNNLWGILDSKGKMVVPFKYSGICEAKGYGFAFWLKEGSGESERYTLLDYDLRVVKENLTYPFEKLGMKSTEMLKETKRLVNNCLENLFFKDMTSKEGEKLRAELESKWLGCYYYKNIFYAEDVLFNEAKEILIKMRELEKVELRFEAKDFDFSEECVIVDIETSGLNAKKDEIIKINAAIVKNGDIKSKFETFVNPMQSLNEKISSLTGITDDMLCNAPPIEKALKEFINFAGDRTIAVYNAPFVLRFLYEGCRKTEIEFNPTYIDMMAMAKKCFPELSNYKTATVAQRLGVPISKIYSANEELDVYAALLTHYFERFNK